MNKIFVRINKLEDSKFVFLSVSLCLAINFIFKIVVNVLTIDLNQVIDYYNFIQFNLGDLFTIAIIGPFFETIIIFIMYILLAKFVSSKKYIFFIISGIFGLLHYYSIWYMAIATILGFVFCYAYLFYPSKRTSSFLIVLFIHSIYNVIVYGLNVFIR